MSGTTLLARMRSRYWTHQPPVEGTQAQLGPTIRWLGNSARSAGHIGLADEISHRLRALCEKSGFAENFDAETGTGLRDRAYTWTASSYLILAAAYARRQ